MEALLNRKKRLFCSLLLGMALTVVTSFFGGGERPEAFGFFGMLYPQFCFSQEGELPAKEGEARITFLWLREL